MGPKKPLRLSDQLPFLSKKNFCIEKYTLHPSTDAVNLWFSMLHGLRPPLISAASGVNSSLHPYSTPPQDSYVCYLFQPRSLPKAKGVCLLNVTAVQKWMGMNVPRASLINGQRRTELTGSVAQPPGVCMDSTERQSILRGPIACSNDLDIPLSWLFILPCLTHFHLSLPR